MFKSLLGLFDSQVMPVNESTTIAWVRVIPFILLHVGCLLVFWVGISKTAIITALILFWGRIFAIGAFYHRYFCHRAFQTNRLWQFIFALLGASAAQRGPLWWAAHHRQHHKVADTPADTHSPVTNKFWWSHIGWFLSHRHYHYNPERVKDWLKFPELHWLDRHVIIVPLTLMTVLYLLGEMLASWQSSWHTSGLQLVVWGFFISTVALFHATVSINSVGHKYGQRRYSTRDQSRNNFWLALLTLGEGWHNNHHYYPATARQGFFWWEIDITYYCLKLMEKLHIVHYLREVPEHVINQHASAK